MYNLFPSSHSKNYTYLLRHASQCKFIFLARARNLFIAIIFICLNIFSLWAQPDIEHIDIGNTDGTYQIHNLETKGKKWELDSRKIPLFSLEVDGELFQSTQKNHQRLAITFQTVENAASAFEFTVRLKNISKDTLKISNIVPLGQAPERVYLTASGPPSLSRTKIFRPNLNPVPVIVPDNAWELGYAALELDAQHRLCGLARRTTSEKAQRRRFETYLYPEGYVEYHLFFELYEGKWQEGLRRIFQERYLYDLKDFDETLFDRKDLEWIRHDYIIHLMMGWDRQFYDPQDGIFHIEEFLARGKKWYGGDDAWGIWPTWPTLGLDQRNQWDLFRDLPGGLPQIKELAQKSRAQGSKFFICYNPWDESTRKEGHLEGMAELIKEMDADGVVLDTRGSSSYELQAAADKAKDGIVMYSEGMAVPKDMPGIVAGRVHNALYYPPMLNLNKFIRPDFAIFRVCELAYDPIKREYATSFFNGYGVEINTFQPGRPAWMEEDYKFLGRTTRILRENSINFLQKSFTPLIPTRKDSIYINHWPTPEKEIYTIFSLIPEGVNEALFEVSPKENWHFVDIWAHEEVELDTINGKLFVPVKTDAFHSKWLGTNNEGAVSAIAHFPKTLNVQQTNTSITLSANQGTEIQIWKNQPDYEQSPMALGIGRHKLELNETFPRFEGKLVIKLMAENTLLDERIIELKAGLPRLISPISKTARVKKAPKGMLKIPTGKYLFTFNNQNSFIPYPSNPYTDSVKLASFFMDEFPVSNADFATFIKATNYQPTDTTNFLKHWTRGTMPKEIADHPVVYVSYEDAQAYAQWAGKRLPTEQEWQYAAQAGTQISWPWGNEFDSTRCNIGTGNLDKRGAFPEAKNPWGLQDLVGSVWQITNDLYDNGSYQFIMLKGGSYFKPTASWWYVQGGPQPLTHRQMLLRVSQGFERNGTVGFRCVKDAGEH